MNTDVSQLRWYLQVFGCHSGLFLFLTSESIGRAPEVISTGRPPLERAATFPEYLHLKTVSLNVDWQISKAF